MVEKQVQPGEKPAGDGTIPIEQAALLLMISAERVRQLIRGGFIPKPEKARVPLVGAVQGYIRFLKDEERRTTKTAAQSRVTDARAREIERRTARDEGELVPLEEAKAFVQAYAGAMISRLIGLPAQITRDLDERRRIEAVLDRFREEMDKTLAELADAYRDGPPSEPPDTEDEPE